MTSEEMGPAAVHEVIVNDDMQYGVWPSSRRLPPGWHHIGKSGPKAQLLLYLREMFVETLPAPLIVLGGRPEESRWGD